MCVGASRGPDPATTAADSTRLDLQPGDLALLSTIPALLGIAAMLGSLASEVDGVPRLLRLGLTRAHFDRSFVPAVAGVLFAYPLVFWVLLAAQAAFSAAGYEHPSEHELLREMGTATSPLLRAALVVGAVVAAPVFEELVFRGGVQTLLRRAFDPTGTRAGPAWAAIGVSSLLFAMVHPLWMAPAIFTLSLCIGYVYERTGNLWAAILLHAAFNAVNTAVYLA
jgi:membrane protease YdiL (CAAX protease family)